MLWTISLLIEMGTAEDPAKIIGFIENKMQPGLLGFYPADKEVYKLIKQKLPQVLGEERVLQLKHEGAGLTIEEAFDLAIKAAEGLSFC